jgi:hypothetical protein
MPELDHGDQPASERVRVPPPQQQQQQLPQQQLQQQQYLATNRPSGSCGIVIFKLLPFS